MLHGPRVRIGVHRGIAGHWSRHLHDVTQKTVYGGQAFNVCSEVGDAAHGGQVVITEQVLESMIPQMAAVRFPLVSPLGVYRLQCTQVPVELFQVQPFESLDMPVREFVGDLRKITPLSVPTSRLSVVSAPKTDVDSPSLTFAALYVADRMALQTVDARASPGGLSPFHKLGNISPRSFSPKGASPRNSSPRSNLSSRSSGSSSSDPELCVHQCVASVVAQRVGVCAAQTGGYIASLEQGNPCGLVVFGTPHAAACFAASLQMALLTAEYDKEALAVCEPEEKASDGRWVFRGVRVAVALHTGTEWVAKEMGNRETTYSGLRVAPIRACRLVLLEMI